MLKALNIQVLTPTKEVRSTNSKIHVKDPSSSRHVHFVNVVTIKPIDRDREEDDEDRIENGGEFENAVNEVEKVDNDEDYFNRLPTKEEREYHKDLFDDTEMPYFLGRPTIKMGDPSNLNIP